MSYEPKWDPTLTSEARCEAIRKCALQHWDVRNFVETGTADGSTCRILSNVFEQLHTIEIVPTLYKSAVNHLAPYSNIQCHFGDSAEVLPGLLEKINAPTFFWLDGHYCGSREARGPKDTPVEDELEIIFATGLPHVVFIDDARLFGRDPAYPTLERVRELITSQDIEYTFSYVDDMMRAIPE